MAEPCESREHLAQVEGSGTVIETSSRRANGGTLLAGAPTAGNDSSSLPAVAVKSKVFSDQPEKEPGEPLVLALW